MNCPCCNTEMDQIFQNDPDIEEDGDTIKRMFPYWCPTCKQKYIWTEWFHMTDCSWSR